MKTLSVLLVMGTLMVLAGSSGYAMPLSPRAVEEAQRFVALSDAVMAPPPEWVNQPIPAPAAGHSGSYNVLLIVIEFSDVANTFSRASFDSMAFNGWATGTIDDYYTEVSYGNLTLSGQALGWYTAGQGRAYYGNGQKGWGTYPQNTGKLVEEAVDAAESAGCDFSQYDNDGDGEAESIFIIHSGQGSETSLDADDIQSHASRISSMGGSARFYDGVTVDIYACCPELQGPAAHINIGVFCHEYGHILGLPDLYDVSRWCTGTYSWGIGAWGLMSYGGWGGDVVTPSSPSHMCSWSKARMGWLTPIKCSGWSSMGTVQRLEEYAVALKLGMDTRETEYLLVEFRDSSYGFDASLVKTGVLIYHVDDDMVFENDCENGGSCTSGGFHYMLALEQPDSSYDLDCGTVGNYADGGDAWPHGLNGGINSTSVPNSNTYDGNVSGASVDGIGLLPGRADLFITCGRLFPEMAYDDSYYNICYRFGLNDAGFALKITPPKYPAQVRGLMFMSCDYTFNDFQCRIYDDSGPGGTPGIPVSPVHSITDAVQYAWTYEDFATDSIYVTSGDFWAVYIEQNNSQLASDNDSPWSGRTMTYYLGNFSPDNGAYGNYMIRGVVDTNYAAGVDPATFEGLSVKAYPNPFRDRVMIKFATGAPAELSLTIYDVSGRRLRDLAAGTYPAGEHSIAWDGLDSEGRAVGAGIYFYRFKSGPYRETGKVSLLR